MNRESFKEYIQKGFFILDGATGTELQKRGMPGGICPEQWVIDNPWAIIDLQKKYVESGSNVVYTCTFGGNRVKLEGFGLGDKVIELNKKLARLSREAVGESALVAGDLAPTGDFIEPFGDLSFEEVVDIYKEQVAGLLEGGVDFFVIETMMDIQEARAALIAVRESCDLPVCVSMTFDENGKTLTGTDPVTALITLQSLGADAVGCNCSTGPKDMLKIISQMKPYAKVPLMAKPNAGLPKLVNGRTVFDMGTEEFGMFVAPLVSAGANMIGGCCGTSPEYIEQIRKNIEGLAPVSPKVKAISALTSSRKTVLINSENKFLVIGERINPETEKNLQDELREGETYEVQRLAAEQVQKGADILNINVKLPGTDEAKLMKTVVEFVGSRFNTPLCIDTVSPEALEAALRIYPGRALVNSISAEKEKIEKLLPVVTKYGAMFILRPLDNKGVPEETCRRSAIIESVYNEAKKYGYEKDDIIVDSPVEEESSNQEPAEEMLKLLKQCKATFGCASVIGKGKSGRWNCRLTFEM
ncbi:MAG TPA: dihydropteroate synthase [Clostridiaceae bacterium]|nr:dihydropteroate synthase [Clostridiaceae bacterium]